MSCLKEEIDSPQQEDAGKNRVAGNPDLGGVPGTDISVVTEQPLVFHPLTLPPFSTHTLS